MAIILDGTNGITTPDLDSTGPITGTTGTFSGVIVAPDGTSSAPSITNDGDTNTGLYFPAADTIGFVCGGTEDFRIDSTGQLWNTVESEVGTDYTTLYKGYLCRAWVNFNGTGTVAIRASGNVSSITDNGTGNYTVNFTTAMPDANYNCTITNGITSTLFGIPIRLGSIVTATTSSVQVTHMYASGGSIVGVAEDCSYGQVAIFR